MTLPRLGQGMESGTIVRWLKQEGDRVEKGEALYELDTEKVTQEVEAEASGVVLRILAGEGEEVEVGKAVVVIGEEGEEVEEAEGAEEAEEVEEAVSGSEPQTPEEEPEAPAEPERAPEQRVSGSEPQSAVRDGRVKASPLARRIARERGIDLARVRGTGPEGRIVAEDVERAEVAPAAAPSAPAEVERVELTRIRRTIARRLTEAWTIPVFQLTVSADMTRVEEVVRRHREANEDVKLTVTDVLTKICAQALLRHRGVNAQYTEEALLRFPTANVGIAVAAPSGLVVPVVRSVERLTLSQVAAAREDLVTRARVGKLRREDLEEGTFTISNLGMPQYGIEQFTAVLNPPQAAILAVGATDERVVPKDGDLELLPMVTLTGTFDHRAVDGADGAEFLATVKAYLEEPGLAL
ncbi:MAG: 2-oxo acid dehydrogenase subunit E2 [Thermoleophilia bacterium]|nr:2-oxo acid dehydrogenase subunit E2 [Thermoleophilia bacterium]